ncbi:MAG: DUF2294 domain-containing protein [Spirochaetes bacterium]|nr:DUF2294 domain-containing protein [Spirochaetota bacterium]
MKYKSKGELEAKITEAIIKFEKDYMGRGPKATKTYLIEDMVFIRLNGVLTPAEEKLTETAEGAKLLKDTRVQLLENGRKVLENLMYNITGQNVVSLYSDISTKRGERVIVFVMDINIEKLF